MPNTLLLADDSVTIRRVIELTFADENMRVVSFSSGREALAGIEASPPDIILADAGMPDVSGYDIAAYVKDRPHLRHIPVILLAGAFEPLDELRARKSGSDGVLVKPFEPQMVVARVRELLSQPVSSHAGPRPAPPSPPVVAAIPAETQFDASLDRLDAAFSNGGSQPAIDETTATDFANDLRALRSTRPDGTGSGAFDRHDFGDWDLPARAPIDPSRIDALVPHEPELAADVFIAPEPVVVPMPAPIALAPKAPPPAPPPPAPALPAPLPVAYAAPPPAPVYTAPPAPVYTPPPAAFTPPPAAVHAPSPAVAPALPLADAFTSLLAAEEGRPHAPIRSVVTASAPDARISDADMELIVDRVLARLGSGVRGAVIDLAERLVKAEIDRLKALR